MAIKISNGILNCNVLIHSPHLTELGVDNDDWINICINMDYIASIRQDYTESVIDESSVITLIGINDPHIVDIPYNQLINEWAKYKSNETDSGNNH
jgi:hypothetical protein